MENALELISFRPKQRSMKWLLRIALSLAVMAIVVLALAGHYYYKGFYRPANTSRSAYTPKRVSAPEADRIAEKAAQLRKFVAGNAVARPVQGRRYSEKLAFLVDMRLPSGKNRFFVYDLGGDSIIMAGLVAHGCGNTAFSLTPSFSNADGSNCSALGRYRVGSPYIGQWSRSYFLYGLDSTNDRALERHIVLHSYDCVPDGETDPFPICNSKGCAMVSPAFLARLRGLIDASKKPVLLWIFN